MGIPVSSLKTTACNHYKTAYKATASECLALKTLRMQYGTFPELELFHVSFSLSVV